jgi:uncharacterized iron-regulated membrane protein
LVNNSFYITHMLKTWLLVHTWASLVCTGCLLLLCLTGLPLICKDEIGTLFDHDVTAPSRSTDTPAISLDHFVAAAQQRYPHEFVRFFWDRDHPNVIKLSIVPTPDADPELSHMLALDAHCTGAQ